MARLCTPSDRDQIVLLARTIIDNRKAVEVNFEVTLPKKSVKAPAKAQPPAARTLKKIPGLEKRLKELAKALEADIRTLATHERIIGNAAGKQTGGSDAGKDLGFTYRAGQGAGGPESPSSSS